MSTSLLACMLMAGAIQVAAPAAAVCYSADCVPNVASDVSAGTPCAPRKYFNYGLTADGATLVCNRIGEWTATGPLIGIYNVALSCATAGTSAQGSDGVAFVCADAGGGQLRWSHRHDTLE